MSEPNNGINLKEISAGMALAVARGAKSTVLVAGSDGYPSSGVVYKPGFILTAEHTLEKDEDITVMLPGGETISATAAGRDQANDLALLKMERAGGEAAEVAAYDPQVGQLVLALGRPTDEGIQASLGIIGIVGGQYRTHHGGAVEGVMRTDATRYPGFSGGPLIDTEGLLIGINVFGHRFGSSLTIPVGQALQIADKLHKEGSIKQGYLGIRSEIVELPGAASLNRDQKTGLLIVGIEQESPAHSSDLMVGDVLIGIQGNPVTNHDELLRALRSGVVGKPVRLELIRGGKPAEVTVTPGDLSDYSRKTEGRKHCCC